MWKRDISISSTIFVLKMLIKGFYASILYFLPQQQAFLRGFGIFDCVSFDKTVERIHFNR